MLKIGEFSKLAQVSPKTLRLYDERGLLRPAWIDRFTGYRYYKPDQLAKLHSILALKDLGFSLNQIGELLAKDIDSAALGAMMRERQKELSRHITAEEARLRRVEARLLQLEGAGSLSGYDIVLKPVRPFTVAGMRRTVPSQLALPDLIDTLRRELRRERFTPAEPVPMLGIYYDDVYPGQDLDVEVAVPLKGQVPQSSAFTVHELPGVQPMACTVHRGPLSLLPQAYEAVLTWLQDSGYQAAGPNRDLFLQGPESREPGERIVAEVQFPARRRPFLSPAAKPKDKQEMEIKIEKLPSFTVVGLPYFGKNENQELPELWSDMNRRCAEVKNQTNVGYGLCQAAEPDGRFHYLAGFGVTAVDELPEGMEDWTVPEQTYAVFPCRLSTIHETYQFAFESWLPQSAYQYSKGIDFELYKDDFDPNTGDGTLYIYIPVEKK